MIGPLNLNYLLNPIIKVFGLQKYLVPINRALLDLAIPNDPSKRYLRQ